MIYIFTYRLKRKNARRRIYLKQEYADQNEAIRVFSTYCKGREEYDKGRRVWELLTGDWKHIAYYCDTCKRPTDEACEVCMIYDEIMKGRKKK